ncbi:MAG: hypothetical protein WBX01_17305 [Nitrososphaeraceae archaeon]|jgi:hypothetical protein
MSTAYANSVEALNDLLSSCNVTETYANISQLTNGIDCTFVEVTCDDGSQYGLQAYGKEAIDLHRRALEI